MILPPLIRTSKDQFPKDELKSLAGWARKGRLPSRLSGLSRVARTTKTVSTQSPATKKTTPQQAVTRETQVSKPVAMVWEAKRVLDVLGVSDLIATKMEREA